MRVIGIIAEYNPFHSGHKHHISEVRRQFGNDCAIVCAMSGNWVQRGDCAITDKWTRSAMALRGGADLIIELPTVWAVSSAESFARGGVFLLEKTGIVDTLSFGSEGGDLEPLLLAARALDSEDYQLHLRQYLDENISFPAARQKAAAALLGDASHCLAAPNNNLGVEYLRAITYFKSDILPSTIPRLGTSHDSETTSEYFASASFLRKSLLFDGNLSPFPYLSQEDFDGLTTAGLSSLSFAERGFFARLRAMGAEDFLGIPDMGGGLHHLFSEASRKSSTLEELYETIKSKRYTHARIRRLVLWAFLGLSAVDRPETPPYLRVLGMNAKGREFLRAMGKQATLPILTKPAHVRDLSLTCQNLFQGEARCTGLYDLCRRDFGRVPGKGEFETNPVVF